jgi:prepilin peptidase CpaA
MDWPVAAGAVPLYALASFRDLALRRIPDRCSIGLLALGAAALLLTEPARLPGALLTAACVFAVLVAAHRARLMGGGDVKLLAASSLLVGPASVPGLVEATALAGGGLAVLYLAGAALARRPACLPRPGRPLWQRLLRVERCRMARRHSLPYGLAIAAGSLVTLFGQTFQLAG